MTVVMLALALASAPLDDDLATLVRWMTGSFSSAAQAEDDDRYYDIRLEMAPIWTDRDDGAWLYVEQAAAAALDRPYRQRVYRVSETEDGLFTSEVFVLPDPAALAGAFREPARLDGLDPGDLALREGCTVVLRRGEGGMFAGSTVGEDCASSLRGAAYATSIVTIGPEGIESWDRGFDTDGNQVWGAEAGPYSFQRTER